MKRNQITWLRLRGANDARLGKKIEAFYELSELVRKNETARAQYEIGYRAAHREMMKEKRDQGLVDAECRCAEGEPCYHDEIFKK